MPESAEQPRARDSGAHEVLSVDARNTHSRTNPNSPSSALKTAKPPPKPLLLTFKESLSLNLELTNLAKVAGQ